MNHYGQLALDHSRNHRPVAYSQIPDPDEFFAEAGEEIAAAITESRDQILGPPRIPQFVAGPQSGHDRQQQVAAFQASGGTADEKDP